LHCSSTAEATAGTFGAGCLWDNIRRVVRLRGSIARRVVGLHRCCWDSIIRWIVRLRDSITRRVVRLFRHLRSSNLRSQCITYRSRVGEDARSRAIKYQE
jgi:hypothetical protein